jgi:hypothetical protein
MQPAILVMGWADVLGLGRPGHGRCGVWGRGDIVNDLAALPRKAFPGGRYLRLPLLLAITSIKIFLTNYEVSFMADHKRARHYHMLG